MFLPCALCVICHESQLPVSSHVTSDFSCVFFSCVVCRCSAPLRRSHPLRADHFNLAAVGEPVRVGGRARMAIRVPVAICEICQRSEDTHSAEAIIEQRQTKTVSCACACPQCVCGWLNQQTAAKLYQVHTRVLTLDHYLSPSPAESACILICPIF